MTTVVGRITSLTARTRGAAGAAASGSSTSISSLPNAAELYYECNIEPLRDSGGSTSGSIGGEGM